MTNQKPAQKSRKTRRKVDPEFMRKIGSKGGKKSTFRGFRDVPGLAQKAGSTRGYKWGEKGGKTRGQQD